MAIESAPLAHNNRLQRTVTHRVPTYGVVRPLNCGAIRHGSRRALTLLSGVWRMVCAGVPRKHEDRVRERPRT
jgi:hypothetical protein